MAEAGPFVGRAPELDRLLRWVRHSPTRAVLVHGEAGIGKSRLVQELAEQACSRGSPQLLVGHCAALTGDALPFSAITEILRQLLGSRPAAARSLVGNAGPLLMHLLPELARGEPPPSPQPTGRLQLFDAVRQVVARSTAGRPTLMVVEDVHWMPEPGLELLDFLLRSQLEQVGFLGTARDHDPTSPLLTRLVVEAERDQLLERLPLGPLPLSAVEAIVASVLGAAPEAAVTRRIHTLAAGNPYYVEELARQAAAGGGAQLPPALTELMTGATPSLSGPARTVLGVVAAAAGPVRHPQLAAVADLDERELRDAVREALDTSQLEVTSDGLGYRFRHELARTAWYDALLPADRIEVHARYASLLAAQVQEARPPDLGDLLQLVHHHEQAGDDASAQRWTLTAAEAAERAHAYRDALDLYQRALGLLREHPPPDRAEQVALILRALRVADRVANHAVGLTVAEEGLQLVDPVTDPLTAGVLEERRAWYRLLTFADPAPTDCRRGVELVPATPPTPQRARVLATHSRLLALFGQADAALAPAAEALEVARVTGSEPERAAALVSMGTARTLGGDPVTGEALLQQGVEVAGALDAVEDLAAAYVLLAGSRLLGDPDLTSVLEVTSAGIEELSRRGVTEVHLHLLTAMAQSELGRWDEADEAAQWAACGSRTHAGLLAEALLLLLATARGEQAPVDRVPAHVPEAELPGQACKWYGEWLAEIALLRGEPAEATACVARALRQLDGRREDVFSGRLLVLGMRAQADRATIGRDTSDGDLVAGARAAAARLVARAGRIEPSPFDPLSSPAPDAAAEAATWEGERVRLAGRPSPDLWAAAASAWLALPRPYPAAYALWRQAESLLSARQGRRDAGPVLRRALILTRRLGALPLQRELDRLARWARVQTPAREQDEAQVAQGAGRARVLTPREAEVLRLMAEGLSNRAISDALVVSLKTVDTHVSHLLGKLDVHDRVAAAGRAQRLGLLG
ncbi:MAG: AAA family ATPase [Mycobacteriales bacterium]